MSLPEGLSRTPEDGKAYQDHITTIVMIADGWSREVFLNLLERGSLPEISEHLIERGALLPNVISNIPSVSIASHASILTSSPQDEHGIPGHRWFDTESRECHDYLRLRGPSRVNSDLAPSVRTIFESNSAHQATISVQSVIHRGADIHVTVPSLRSGPILKRLGELIVAEKQPTTAVAWLPRGDSLSHVHGPKASVVEDDMVETSRAIGKLAAQLGRAGLLDRSRILLIPDHGHRAVRSTSSLERIFERVGAPAQINPRRSSSVGSVVMTSGDSSAYVYLDRSSPSADAVANRLASEDAITLICWRDPEGLHHFLSRDGQSYAVPLDGGNAQYQVVGGVDPLRMQVGTDAAVVDLQSPRLQSSDGWAEGFPDFLHQYLRSAVPRRSGAMLVFSAAHTHFGRGPRLGWRLGFHRGTHGGPFQQEVLVAAAYRGEVGIDPRSAIRSADVLRELGLLATESTPMVT